ncbi:MAG TPA: hypothetical protein VL854_05665 [Nitrososphaeraceae archaeon]|nr:hypothetical protein [Nitrososphaeraceae archaeon]
MNDKEVQARYAAYCSQFNELKCPNCKHELTVTITESYAPNDDLLSKADFLCKKCDYTTQIVKKYSDCITTI